MTLGRTLLVACALLALRTPVLADHIPCHWDETLDGLGDAGELLSDFQTPIGTGPLDLITGELTSADDVDLFQFFITATDPFEATTVGLAAFDTRLFLFDESGLGVTANDNFGGTLQSTISGNLAQGTYFLAVAQGSKPIDSFGNGIFDASGAVVSVNPLFDWEPGTGIDPPYGVGLQGVAFVPEPSSFMLCTVGMVCLVGYGWRRKRKIAA